MMDRYMRSSVVEPGRAVIIEVADNLLYINKMSKCPVVETVQAEVLIL